MESTVRLRILVLVGLVLVPLVLSLPIAWYTGEWGGLALNLCTELIGAGLTYVLLEMVIGRRERREAKKADLIAQMGSRVKDVAIAAAEELKRHRWLFDGSLQGADLVGANLQGVDLGAAKLQDAILFAANLQGAYLEFANLQEARLIEANLQGAYLSDANLHGASLARANLQGASLLGADLRKADLREADLREADLEEANLEGAKSDDNTTLPDSTEWTPDTDMTRFTDPDHPDFWRPDA